jgi:hypothetical protein
LRQQPRLWFGTGLPVHLGISWSVQAFFEFSVVKGQAIDRAPGQISCPELVWLGTGTWRRGEPVRFGFPDLLAA